jgi:hypothetical protein
MWTMKVGAPRRVDDAGTPIGILTDRDVAVKVVAQSRIRQGPGGERRPEEPHRHPGGPGIWTPPRS